MIESEPELPFPEEAVLLRELNHRINNEYAFVIAIVTRVAAVSGNTEVKAALARISGLLYKAVDVHRTLERPQHDVNVDGAAYLRKLCTSISRSRLDHMKITMVLAASPLQLPSDHCWLLGMIVYELITNSARHAFTNGSGEIRVELFRTGPFVECRVLDNGSVPAAVQPGRGLSVVNELARTLAGRLEHQFGTGGTRSILSFPWRPERQRTAHERTMSQTTAAVPRVFQASRKNDGDRGTERGSDRR
jgi:two-component sensor histidine kinase